MAVRKIKWSNLLNLSEIDFEPEMPKQLVISDEVVQALSWLTGATKHDRKLLRCDDNGVLLTGDAWSNLVEVETDELYLNTDVSDTAITTVPNKGCLIATSIVPVKIGFKRFDGADYETVYLPPNWLYWLPFPVYQVLAALVPARALTACYVGLTFYN